MSVRSPKNYFDRRTPGFYENKCQKKLLIIKKIGYILPLETRVCNFN